MAVYYFLETNQLSNARNVQEFWLLSTIKGLSAKYPVSYLRLLRVFYFGLRTIVDQGKWSDGSIRQMKLNTMKAYTVWCLIQMLSPAGLFIERGPVQYCI